MIVRCTRKVLDQLPPDTPIGAPPAKDDDWYLNLLWIERRKCVLLAHAGTLFAVFRPTIRKAALRDLTPLVTEMITTELERAGLPHHTFGPVPPDVVVVTKTASRHTLGHMNEMATHLRYAIDHHGGLDHTDINALHHQLHRTLHNRGGDYVRPIDLARAPRRSS